MNKMIDDSVCPLCQQQNFCAVNKQQACWCSQEKIPKALISQVPDALKRKSCICQACVKKFNLALIKEVR